MRKRLLGVNRPTAPYRIIDGASDGVEVIPEWTMVDASWHEIFGKAETFAPGQVYNYRFDTSEIKRPIQEAVTSCGWTYKGVAFGKL